MSIRRWLLAGVACAGIVLAQGIASRGVRSTERGKASGLPFTTFIDLAAKAGLTRPVIYGGVERTDYLVETSSGGVALFDIDNDGWLDIFIAGGTRFGQTPQGAGNHLYRNRGDGTFEDITDTAGVRAPGWASGACVGDYDNDGFTDLFVTYWGRNILYRNLGNGRFADVTRDAHLEQTRPAHHPFWGSGATFVDYDRDGDLDLFVANYVDFNLQRIPKPGQNSTCNWKGVPVACGPRGLPTARHFLFRNDGPGGFADVSKTSGIEQHGGSYGMTAVSFDANSDGWPDIFVACDSTPSLLFINQRNGTFAEEALERGIALSQDGAEQAGMGVAIGDWNLDGTLDLFKSHFADDTHALYQGGGKGVFEEVTLPAGIGVETRYVGWGAGFADFDNDGLPDLLVATGGVYPETDRDLPAYPFKTPSLLFRNLGSGKFEEIGNMSGPGVAAARSSRGAAFGDLDNDGDLDVVIMNRNEPPSVLINQLERRQQWLRVHLTGVRSNRSAIGAVVTAIYSRGKQKQTQVITSQSSFYSANDLRLHFGLGQSTEAALEIRWPSGTETRHEFVHLNRTVAITEPREAGSRLTPSSPKANPRARRPSATTGK